MKMGTFVLRQRGLFNLLVICALVFGFLPVHSQSVLAASPDLVISQVYGGGGNSGAPYTHDFVELFNRGSAPVSLAGMSIQYASATGTGNFGSNPIVVLSGLLAPGQYYLVQLAGGANGISLPAPDAIGTVNMSGASGKVALINSTSGLACNGGSTACSPDQLAQIIDLVGYGGANFFEGTGAAPTLTNTTAALRANNGCIDTDDNASDFSADAPAPRNTASPMNVCQPIGDMAPYVVITVPADGDTEVAPDASIVVTFSEPVNVTASWFDLTCTVQGAVAATYSGGPETFTVVPDAQLLEDDTCTFTVYAAEVTDQDEEDPPDTMEADTVFTFATQSSVDVCTLPFTPIYDIQGSGMATPLAGQTVTTQGVVIGDYEGPAPALRGFYIQDLIGDGNAETSDGVFVFNGNNNSVNLGDIVRLSGTAGEFQDQTQISNVVEIIPCGTGSVEPVDVLMPFASATYLERYEGMLVRFPQTLYVTEHFQLGRFGQVVMSSGGRLQQPTNMVEPGAPAQALQAANNLNRIIVDDAINNQNPDPIVFGRGGLPLSASNTLRGGDTAAEIVGVMTYTWAGNAASGNAYRVRPINALGGGIPNFQPANPRPEQPEDVGGTLKVTGFNVLNYFNTFGRNNCTFGVDGAPTDCRGADNELEFDRQAAKIVAAMMQMDADIVGLIEIENDGYGPDSAIQDLVNRLNAATGAGTYALIDVDAETGQLNAMGTDAIKVGFIYKPGTVTPVGMTAALNSEEFVTGGDSGPRNRPALAQAFEENSTGGRLTVVVNHLKSKGSICDLPDTGDGQGNCNIVRLNAALLMAEWLRADPTGIGDPDVLIVGDLNSYAMEDPIMALEEFGFTNLILEFVGPDAYSYVFDGQWGYLDHALGSASLVSQVTGVTEYHINSDEPNVLDYNTNFKSPGQITSLYAPDEFRASDHDPVIVGLNMVNAAPVVGEINIIEDPVRVNTLVAASVDFTDADLLDTHTAVWKWGDGTTTTGIVLQEMGGGTVMGEHIYTKPGIYYVTATVYDNFGNYGKSISHPVVIYDPNGGFVTGGGWIYSAPGAVNNGSDADGKAQFAFVSKYQKNAAKPKGNVIFTFNAGNVNFRSTSIEYLVVNSAGTQAIFKGSGVLNEVGNYKYMVWAGDGNPDTFRIKIWTEKHKIETVIYDNGFAQPVGGGSIQIHTAK
jgi:uncharacterized protein